MIEDESGESGDEQYAVKTAKTKVESLTNIV